MKPEAIAEVIVSPVSLQSEMASPCSSFGFILTFGEESFSAAVLPDGSGSLRPSLAERVRLRFLVETARDAIAPGREFTFREGHRTGRGKIVEVCNV